MAVTLETMEIVRGEIGRLTITMDEAEAKMKEDKYAYRGCAETAAVRRASMDVTRVLTELRR